MKTSIAALEQRLLSAKTDEERRLIAEQLREAAKKETR